MKPEKLTDRWATPRIFVKGLEITFGQRFTVDAAASEQNAKCRRFISRVQDGRLAKHYTRHDLIFCNPPYSNNQIASWVDSAFCTSGAWVFVLPNSTETQWFKRLAEQAYVYFVHGRISFEPPSGLRNSTNRGSNIVAFIPPRLPSGQQLRIIPPAFSFLKATTGMQC